jgi:predicted regulator of Ras-like GTPase activity (Roadblock/LC7/MglB family)
MRKTASAVAKTRTPRVPTPKTASESAMPRTVTGTESGPESGTMPDGRIAEILGRLSATEGMREVFLVSGDEATFSGRSLEADRAGKIVTLVRMLSEVNRKAATQMKQGVVRQLVVFGTEGMVMVSPAGNGTLVAVAGAGVKVGLLRLALNDCLKRLAEVS